MGSASTQISRQSGVPSAEHIATTPSNVSRSSRWSTVSDLSFPGRPHHNADADRIDSAFRLSRSKAYDMLYSTEATMWAKLLEDVVGICAEKVVQYRRPTFRAVDHLTVVIINPQMPSVLGHADDTSANAAAKRVAGQFLDDHDWTTDDLPQAHLDRIKANLPAKVSLFHALLMDDILIKKLEEAGSLLAFTQDLVAVIEDTMFSYIHFQLLAEGHHDLNRHTKLKIIPILVIACLSKTDSPAESRAKMRDRLDDIIADDFALLDPSSKLPADWVDTAITTLETECSYYSFYLRALALRNRGPRAGVTVGKSALKRLFSSNAKSNTLEAPTAASLGRARSTHPFAKPLAYLLSKGKHDTVHL